MSDMPKLIWAYESEHGEQQWETVEYNFAVKYFRALDAEAKLAELEKERAFTLSDGQRLMRKQDVAGICPSPDTCFVDDQSCVRCGPCASAAAASAGVELNKYTISNPQAMRLQRELTAAEATVATLQAQVDAMRLSAMKAMTIANGALDPTATEKTFRRDLVQIREELRGALWPAALTEGTPE